MEKVDESPAIQSYYDQFPNVDTFNGTASFVDNHTVAIDLNDGSSVTLTGDKVFVATGGGRISLPCRAWKKRAI